MCGKLLTLVSTRDFIEDNADEQRAAKQELRELKAEQHRREREEAAERYGLIYTCTYLSVQRFLCLETISCISMFQGSKKKGGEAEGTGTEIERKT